MSAIQTSEAIDAWKRAHRFVLDLYRLTNRLPAGEQAGLTPKIRTSAVKVASNIVEGYARKSNAAYLGHLSESQVALEETKYSLLVIRDLGYVSEQQYDLIMAQAEDVSERLTAMHAKLSVAEAAKPGAPALPAGNAPAFGVKKGVRATVRDLWKWASGGEKAKREAEPHIWTEDAPVPNYLEEAVDFSPSEPISQFEETTRR